MNGRCQCLLTPRRAWSIDTLCSYAAQGSGGSSALALAPVALHEVHEGVPMHCPRCGFANPEGMHFCGHCGTALSSGCPHCGFESPPGFAFCGKCGAPLTRQPPASAPSSLAPQPQTPFTYTPHHLAEKILMSRRTLEGERRKPLRGWSLSRFIKATISLCVNQRTQRLPRIRLCRSAGSAPLRGSGVSRYGGGPSRGSSKPPSLYA